MLSGVKAPAEARDPVESDLPRADESGSRSVSADRLLADGPINTHGAGGGWTVRNPFKHPGLADDTQVGNSFSTASDHHGRPTMRKVFLEFLTGHGLISPEQFDQIQGLLRGAPEPIGSIAFSYGMIAGKDIDSILDEQRRMYRPFGEIAVSKGLLTNEQVETLLGIQRIRAAAESAEALALSGTCTIQEIIPQLGRFLLQYQDSLLCTEN
jgi:hypothetical protein